MASPQQYQAGWRTSDGQFFTDESAAIANQRALNLRQEFAELVSDAGFGSSANAVVDFLVNREADIRDVYEGGDFEPAA